MRGSLVICSLLAGLLLWGSGPAQGQLIKARNLLEQGEFLEAKPFADDAVQKEKNAEKARAWYYRGKIHYKLFRSPKEAHRNYVKKNGAEVSRIAVDSYLKALKFDDKGKFQKEIEKELPVLKSALLNFGYKAFKKRDYEGAYRAFDLGVKAGEALSENSWLRRAEPSTLTCPVRSQWRTP